MKKPKYNIGDLVKMNPIYHISQYQKNEISFFIVLDYVENPFEHYILTNLFDDDKIIKYKRTKQFVEKYYDQHKTSK